MQTKALPGFREFYPADLALRTHIVRTWRTVATRYGFPVSTTHVISSSVMGAGATTRVSAVRWGVAADIVTAWLLTIPAAGLVAAGTYELLSAFM